MRHGVIKGTRTQGKHRKSGTPRPPRPMPPSKNYHYYLLSHIFFKMVQNLSLRLGDSKSPQNSRTFLRILAEFRMTVFCSATILVSIPISLSLLWRSLGVVPKAPITIGMICTLIFHNFLSSLARSWYFSSFSNSIVSTRLSYGIAKSTIRHSFFTLSLMTKSGRPACMA